MTDYFKDLDIAVTTTDAFPREVNTTYVTINPTFIHRVKKWTKLKSRMWDYQNERRTREAQVHISVNKSSRFKRRDSLLDRGANGGIAGEDCIVINRNTDHSIDVTGVDSHQVTNVPTGTVGALIETDRGDIIGIFHQYGLLLRGHTMHSCVQFESFNNDVDDRSIHNGGRQRIITPDGYVIPVDIREGLPFIRMRPYTEQESKDSPHVIMTSDEKWNPTTIDSIISHDQPSTWRRKIRAERRDRQMDIQETPFNSWGDYMERVDDGDIETADKYNVDVNNVRITDIEAQDRWGEIEMLAQPDRGGTAYPYGAENYVKPFNIEDAYVQAELDDIWLDEEHLEAIRDEEEFPTSVYQAFPAIQREVYGLGGPQRTISDKRYEELNACLGYMPKERVKATLSATTQYGKAILAGPNIKERYKSTYPALNVPRRHEAVATDTIMFSTPAIGTGNKEAQVFFGRSSLFCDIYGMKSEKQFPNALEDNIREHGAMDALISDSAKSENSQRVRDIQRSYRIEDWQSEPHQQQQNYAKRAYRDLKGRCKKIAEASRANPNEWELILQYSAEIHNRSAVKSLGERTPYEALTGQTPDISHMLVMPYGTHVAIKNDPGSPASEPAERFGKFVGLSKNVGHPATFKILDLKTMTIIHRSRGRLVDDVPSKRAVRAVKESGKGATVFDFDDIDDGLLPLGLKTTREGEPNVMMEVYRKGEIDDPEGRGWGEKDSEHPAIKLLPTIDLSKLPGRSYYRGIEEEKVLSEIVKAEQDHIGRLKLFIKDEIDQDNDPLREHVILYGQVIDFIDDRMDSSLKPAGQIREIIKHRRVPPSKRKKKEGEQAKDPYEFLVSYWDGTILWTGRGSLEEEANKVLASDYLRRNGLLKDKYYKKFRNLAIATKNMLARIFLANRRPSRPTHRYKYGVKVPQGHQMAMRFDKENGDNRWKEAEEREVSAIYRQKVFRDLGKGAKPPPGYKRIRVHMVYDAKASGLFKARLVVDGNLTELPAESVYLSVVSLRSVRIIAFLAELNGLLLWATDVGNAYIESFTSEKVYVIAGEEFGDLEGHTLVIERALYGLRTSGRMWAERFAEVLTQMGFFPCMADNDVWMRDAGDHYEYIGVYVDDLEIASKDPQQILDDLMKIYKFHLKGSGPLEFHLGCDFFRDRDGVLCQSPKKYIQRMVDNYSRLFGKQPRHYKTPLERGDHPELDDSEFLDADEIKIYQSLIGSLQWAVSLMRFDISPAVVSLAGQRTAPRKGHLERAKRIIGYLSGMKDATLRYRTERPDFSGLDETQYDWDGTMYEDLEEEIPVFAPPPKGKIVDTTTYTDASLYFDVTSGKSLQGNLTIFNKTIIEAFCAKQPVVYTSTYGSESHAARVATERILDMRMTLRLMGVPVGRSVMLGDSRSVVDSMTRPQSKCNKRHTMLSFHSIRAAIANGVMSFYHVPGKLNAANCLTENWGYHEVWPVLKALLFYPGDTADLIDEDEPTKDGSDIGGVKKSSADHGISEATSAQTSTQGGPEMDSQQPGKFEKEVQDQLVLQEEPVSLRANVCRTQIEQALKRNRQQRLRRKIGCCRSLWNWVCLPIRSIPTLPGIRTVIQMVREKRDFGARSDLKIKRKTKKKKDFHSRFVRRKRCKRNESFRLEGQFFLDRGAGIGCTPNILLGSQSSKFTFQQTPV